MTVAAKEHCELTHFLKILSSLTMISFASKIINPVSCFHAWAREIKTQGLSSWTVWEDQKLSFHLKVKQHKKKKKETTLLASISDAMETLENKLCN